MKALLCSMAGALTFAEAAVAEPVSKVTYPVPVDAGRIDDTPYRFTGVVVSELGRGSGFCAWNPKTFFSAAHVVYDGEWTAPPLWYGAVNSDTLDPEDEVQSRGYFRWNAYAELADLNGAEHPRTFGKDVILAYALTDLAGGDSADLDLQGFQHLKVPNPVMITGYPAEIPYTGATNTYFMHQTGPVTTSFKGDRTRYVGTTLISTGPGNSGGPVWSQFDGGPWKAAGVLVAGLAGETGVYALSPDVNSLIRVASPVVGDVPGKPISVSGVGASSFVYSMTKPKQIPDGVPQWTNFRFSVSKFATEAKVSKVRFSLDIDTSHRGDLAVWLQGPGGAMAQLALEEGGSEQDFVLTDEDLSSYFSGISANGQWTLRVQDRLKGDIATVNRIVLEIGCD